MASSNTVMLLLVGLSGSGKSRFCENLLVGASQPWMRVGQDLLKTRKTCLTHSKWALEEKRSVLVDRCNFDVEQRSEFLKLAAAFGVAAHALVLDLPQSLCVERASKGVGHEGKVEGDEAERLIGIMSRGRKYPSLDEGLHRITFCGTDSEVEKALQQYRGLGVSQTLEPGVFGEVGRALAWNPQARSSQSGSAFERTCGISEDLARNKDQNLGQGGGMPKQGSFGGRNSEREQKFSCSYVGPSGGMENRNSSHRNWSEEDRGGEMILAFPSISTLDFQFDTERASNVLVEVVSEFLLEPENSKLRLMMIDLTDSAILSKVRRKALDLGLDSRRFFTHVGDITRLRSSGGPACKVIANAANWKLKPGGGGVNLAIYNAAGPELDKATKAVKQTLQPGEGILVSLPQSSPLHQQEGVTHVIHILGPNMNPRRPNCLAGDYNTGCGQLRNAYKNLFRNFSLYASQNVAGFGEEVEDSLTCHNRT